MCSVKEPELAPWEGRQFAHWNKMLLLLCAELWNWNINSTIFKKIQQNCASSMESCSFFVWVFWVYFNLQRFSFVPLLSLALIPFLLPLQELVLLIFSLGRWAVVSVVNSKGQSTWKRQVWSGSLPMISLCLPTESSVPLQPPNPLFVWTKSVGWSKNLKYLKLKGGVNKGCLASSPPRF